MDHSTDKPNMSQSPTTQSSLQRDSTQPGSTITYEIHGHMLSDNDVDNPKKWPLYRKLYASATAFAYAYAVAFGLTAYTPPLSTLPTYFSITPTLATVGFSLYLFGISLAPIYAPHLSERYGRVPVYLVCMPVWMLFVLGTGLAGQGQGQSSFAAVAVCRFFAGVTGGPALVLIEGTFADVWSGRVVGRYYAGVTVAGYVGAASGPLIGGFVFAAADSWQWMQWITLMVGLAAYLFGIGAPETYAREIVRRRAKRHGVPHTLPPAESGVTLREMAQITFFTPLKMLVTEPLVIMISLYLALNFALLFQWFITVPVALKGAFGFDIQQVGLAFISAILGVLMAALTTTVLDVISAPRATKQASETVNINIEYRLYPAMIGCIFIPASLFWVGWTASPAFTWAVPVVGTLFYVWGSALTLIAFISYLFDAYPARGTLSALTAAACLRIICAGWLPIVILQMFMGLTPAWALSTFGFIAIALIPIPFVIFIFGARLRARSKYAGDSMMIEGHAHTMSEA